MTSRTAAAGLWLALAVMGLLALPRAQAQTPSAPCGRTASIRPADLPAVAEALRAGGGCRQVELVLPVDWTYDAASQKLSLFPAPSPYPAIGLSQLALAGSDARIEVYDDYLLSYLPPVPRAQPRTPDDIKACRRAHRSRADYPDQDEVKALCASQTLKLLMRFANPDDLAVDGKLVLAADREPALRQGGVFVRIGLRLDSAAITDDYRGWFVVNAALQGITLADGTGAVLARGVSSDGLQPSEPVKAKWVRRPSGDDASRYYPERALRENLGGRASVDCRVGHLGTMRKCVVVSEDPADYGFGDAALKMARTFRMAPASPDGPSIAGLKVRLPIRFAVPDETPAAPPAGSKP